MSELGELFKALKEDRKLKKEFNYGNSIEILKNNGIKFEFLSTYHIKIGEFNFWPSTGLFIHVKTKKRGRGVFNLIRRISK